MIKLKKFKSDEIQDYKLKVLMMSFKAFKSLIQESYDVRRVAYARSQRSPRSPSQREAGHGTEHAVMVFPAMWKF
jgi:hypothetical protein